MQKRRRTLSVFAAAALLIATLAGATTAPPTEPPPADLAPGRFNVMPARLVAPEQAIVLNVNGLWRRAGAGWAGRVGTDLGWRETIDGHPVFHVAEPGRRRVWVYPNFTQPIDFREYPILIMTYRARHPGDYAATLRFGTNSQGRGSVGKFTFKDGAIQGDGEIHTLMHDMRDDIEAMPGPIESMNFGLSAGPNASLRDPALFELIDVRFERPFDAEPLPRYQPGEAIAFEVVDPQGEPVQGARLTIDAERLNFARFTITDRQGRGSLTPLKVGESGHMLEVSKPGYARVWVFHPEQSPHWPVRVVIYPTSERHGREGDARAVVAFRATASETAWGRNQNGLRTLIEQPPAVPTDAQGWWYAPAIAPGDEGRVDVQLVLPQQDAW